jgi:predicted phage terminase large subunit-like protein
MPEIPDHVRKEAKKELARRFFWDFEQALYPDLFRDDRKILQTVAETLQDFIDNSPKHYLVLSLPPGFYKSFTAKNLAMWLMGRNPANRVIGAANSGDLSSMFSTQVRDTILGTNYGKGGISYPQIFPNTRIKPGFATKSKWELEGSAEPSYRATSPTSALTGSRADYFIIDDIIKNATEALNAKALEDHFNWYRNTLFSRADGDNYKFIFVMQRWATNDLSGRIIGFYGDDVDVIDFPVETDGVLLDETIVSQDKLAEAKRTLAPEVFKANYYQHPVDIEGRLYKGFNEWDKLPDATIKRNTTDVADEGTDNVCSINWFSVKTEDDVKVYVTDIYYSPEKAEVTEPAVAKMINAGEINEAEFESNNGGKGYARNIERELHALNNFKTVVIWTPQTSNKEARILASSAWVAKNVYMPPNWTSKYPEFAAEVLGYVAGGKNQHDDGVDVLATVYERAANTQPIEYGGVR